MNTCHSALINIFTKSLHRCSRLFPLNAYRSETLLDSTKIQFLNGEVVIFGLSSDESVKRISEKTIGDADDDFLLENKCHIKGKEARKVSKRSPRKKFFGV